MKREKNNDVVLCGKVQKGIEHIYTFKQEKFYLIYLAVERKNQKLDIIPVMVSEKNSKFSEINEGTQIYVKGEFRSHNKKENERKRKVELYVFARKIEIEKDIYDINSIRFTGFVCKPVKLRKTSNQQYVSDIMLAVSRNYICCDYIPCIAWGEIAIETLGYKVGEKIEVYGKIRSRKYHKKLKNGEREERIVYEVSVNEIIKK